MSAEKWVRQEPVWPQPGVCGRSGAAALPSAGTSRRGCPFRLLVARPQSRSFLKVPGGRWEWDGEGCWGWTPGPAAWAEDTALRPPGPGVLPRPPAACRFCASLHPLLYLPSPSLAPLSVLTPCPPPPAPLPIPRPRWRSSALPALQTVWNSLNALTLGLSWKAGRQFTG